MKECRAYIRERGRWVGGWEEEEGAIREGFGGGFEEMREDYYLPFSLSQICRAIRAYYWT